MVQTEVKEMVRVPITVTLPKKCVDWLNQKVENRVYANRSFIVEILILEAMKQEQKE
jgi:Arc/MetJ-type ribon-helix-helix transcriptional regulator